MEDNASLAHWGQRFLVQIDQIVWRYQVVRLFGDGLVGQNGTFVGFVDIAETTILRVHIIQCDPGRDHVVTGRTLEVEVVLMVWFSRTEMGWLHKDLVTR